MRKQYRVEKSGPGSQYERGSLITDEQLIKDYLATLSDTEDADHIGYIQTTNKDEAVAYIADAWEMELTYVGDDMICPICGGRLLWQNDNLVKDIFDDSTGYDEYAIISDYICMNCGRLVTITDPTEEDKKLFDFWKKS